MKMKKFKVYATSVIQYEIEIMAEDKYDALDRAEQIDGAEWAEDETSCSDWEVTRAEEVKK
jgi:hypothetical protein